jgi:hypothetical protein
MKNRLSRLGGILLLLLVFPFACSPSSTSVSDRSTTTLPGISPSPSPATPPAAQSGGAVNNGATGVSQASDQRMIVRTADVYLVVNNVTDVRDRIASLAENLTGFVVSSSIRGEGQGTIGSISIRVPDDQFNPTLIGLRKLAVRVQSESTNAQDVTEQYTDLQARLKNAQATESQYVTILSQAKTVDDTLKVYNALSQVRQQIEQLQGQIQYLERTTSMSLINVQLITEGTTAQLVTPGWSPLEVLKSATRAIISFGKVLVNVLIWVAIFSPVWGAAIAIRWFFRRKAKKNAVEIGTKGQNQNTVK